jgi:hypothetical protein
VLPALRKWENAIDAFLGDRVISAAEERELERFAQELGLTKADRSTVEAKLDRVLSLSRALQGRALPVNGDMNLKSGEVCLFSASATLLEERTRREYVGGSRGISIRIAKGLSYRVGASRGYSVPVSHVVEVCDGTFSITNRRCIFTGPRKTVTVPIENLISFTPFEDGIQLHHEKSKGLQVFKFADGEYAAAVLSGLLSPLEAASNDVVSMNQPIDAATARSAARDTATSRPLSAAASAITIIALILLAPVGIALAWWLKRWSVPVRIAASIASLTFFVYVFASGSSKDGDTAVSETPPPPAQQVATRDAGVTVPREDEAAWVVQHCKPDKDTTTMEGGQPIRHLVYRKPNVELIYARDPGEPEWQLVGRFKANKDERLSEKEASRRLPCAKGHLATVSER